MHPACVQILLYATTLPFASRTTAAGPTPGAVKPSACPTWRESRFVMVRPCTVGVAFGDGDAVADGGSAARDGSRGARPDPPAALIPDEAALAGGPASALATPPSAIARPATSPPRSIARRMTASGSCWKREICGVGRAFATSHAPTISASQATARSEEHTSELQSPVHL